MNTPTDQPNERLLELLCERAAYGLGPDQAQELSRLLAGTDEPVDVDGLDLAAAVYRVYSAGVIVEPLPASLADKLIERARSNRREED